MNKISLKTLYTSGQIQKKVARLAGRISRDYKGKELLVIAVLKGSIIFAADLLRKLKIDCQVDFISVSSYKDTKSTGVVRLLMDLRDNPAGKHLLVIDEIADSGRTLKYLVENLKTRKPASIKTCVLFDKPGVRQVPVKLDYKGFRLPNKFVVGYGLDHNERYRNLPYLAVLEYKKETKEK